MVSILIAVLVEGSTALRTAWTILFIIVALAAPPAISSEKCEKYVKHVVDGDFGKNPRRLVRPPARIEAVMPGDFISTHPKQEAWENPVVIKGGLHTFQGLRKFLAQRPDLILLGSQNLQSRINPASTSQWYFLNVDPVNGVGYVRLPENAYHKSALKTLWEADLKSQSGYLWKTLFPENYSTEDIQGAVAAVLASPTETTDRGWAQKSVGRYQLRGGPPVLITVISEKKTGKVISAYPSYQQLTRNWGKNHSPLGKLSIVSAYGYLPKAEQLQDWKQAIARMMAIPEGKRYWKLWYSNPEWSQLNRSTRERHMVAPFTLIGRPISGNLGAAELLATQGLPDYRPGSILVKSFHLVESVLRDNDISVEKKAEFLAMLVLNHSLHNHSFVLDIAWAKYLLQTCLSFIGRLDIGYQQYLMEVIEESPIYWTIAAPWTSWKNSDPLFNAARFLAFFGPNGDFNTEPENAAREREAVERFFGVLDLNGWDEWAYFKRLAEMERRIPGYATKSTKRKKLFTEFLNAHFMFSAYYRLNTKEPEPFIILEKTYPSLAVLAPWEWSRVQRRIAVNAATIERVFGHESGLRKEKLGEALAHIKEVIADGPSDRSWNYDISVPILVLRNEGEPKEHFDVEIHGLSYSE